MSCPTHLLTPPPFYTCNGGSSNSKLASRSSLPKNPAAIFIQVRINNREGHIFTKVTAIYTKFRESSRSDHNKITSFLRNTITINNILFKFFQAYACMAAGEPVVSGLTSHNPPSFSSPGEGICVCIFISSAVDYCKSVRL